jgi:hypothetical protein
MEEKANILELAGYNGHEIEDGLVTNLIPCLIFAQRNIEPGILQCCYVLPLGESRRKQSCPQRELLGFSSSTIGEILWSPWQAWTSLGHSFNGR